MILRTESHAPDPGVEPSSSGLPFIHEEGDCKLPSSLPDDFPSRDEIDKILDWMKIPRRLWEDAAQEVWLAFLLRQKKGRPYENRPCVIRARIIDWIRQACVSTIRVPRTAKQRGAEIPTLSLHHLIFHDGQTTELHEILPDTSSPDPFHDPYQDKLDSLSNLPLREAFILGRAQTAGGDLTFREMSQILKITESRVCQLYWKAINTLRARRGLPPTSSSEARQAS